MRRQGVWRAGALAVVLLGGLVGCGLGPGTVDEAMWSSVPCVTDGESPRTSGYELVPTDLLPYAREERTVVDLTAPEPTTDDDGVLQVTWKDHDGPVYHPVNTAAYGLSLLESYRVTGEQDYLDRAAANASVCSLPGCAAGHPT